MAQNRKASQSESTVNKDMATAVNDSLHQENIQQKMNHFFKTQPSLDESNFDVAKFSKKSLNRNIDKTRTRYARHKSESPVVRKFGNMDRRTMERMNNIALKGMAFKNSLDALNSTFSFNSSTAQDMASTKNTLAQATLNQRRWTVKQDPSRLNILPKTSSRNAQNLSQVNMDIVAAETHSLNDQPFMQQSQSKMLTTNISAQKLPIRFLIDSSLDNRTDDPQLIETSQERESSWIRNQTQSTTGNDFLRIQNAPTRKRLLPELNHQTDFDTTIYSPKEHLKAQNIIKRQMQMSETKGSLQSRLSGFMPSKQGQQSTATFRPAFNSQVSKMPTIIANSSIQLDAFTPKVVRNIAFEMTRTHDKFERYNRIQDAKEMSLVMQQKETAISPRKRPGLKLKNNKNDNFHFASAKISGIAEKMKSIHFLERLQEQEEDEKAELEIITVEQILNDHKTRHDIDEAASAKRKASLPKVGPNATNYANITTGQKSARANFVTAMPAQYNLEKALKTKIASRKECILNEVSKNSKLIEGIVSVNEAADKFDKGRTSTSEQVNQYVKKFSELADLDTNHIHNKNQSALHAFADYIKGLAKKHLVMIQIQRGLVEKFTKSKSVQQPANTTTVQVVKSGVFQKKNQALSRRNSVLPAKKQENKFETLFQKANYKESSTIKNKADEIVQRIDYYQKFKKRDMDEGNNKNDPALKYFKRCLEKNSLLLPIFEKIYRKTLCLQDYMLSEGQCQGIAEACQYIDHKKMNRILFSNCGLTGNKIAIVLEGLASIKDFKSIIYKHNELNSLAIAKLEALFFRQVPDQLAELQIIDCKIHCSVIEQLCELMVSTDCQVRNLALVNVHHSETSFTKLCKYVRESRRLRELNVSWQYLRPTSFYQLFNVIKQNRTLVSLNISWNKFIEDQSMVLTDQHIEQGLTEVPLSQRNTEILNCLAEFIKYNTFLVHLDLTNCGLFLTAVKYVCTFLNKAQALQCLHLTGNEGINLQTLNWIVERIHGYMAPPEVVVAPQAKEFAYREFKSHPMRKGGLIKLMRRNESMIKQPLKADSMMWKDIREGLKLREIVQSKRINEQSQIEMSTDKTTLIIQRHLGFKELLPMSAKWQVCANEYSECWYCNYHILTLFVWVPRISQMAENKDPEVRYYYESALDRLAQSPGFTPIAADGIPNVLGSFTNWKYQPMRQVVPFVIQNDQHPPNFIRMAIQQNLVRQVCMTGPNAVAMKPDELAKVEAIKQDYYQTNWQRLLLQYTRFANPNIANANSMTKLSLEIDPTEPVYFHAAFLKPGRTTYLIERQQKPREETQDELVCRLLACLEGLQDVFEREKSATFHVHQMLTGFRSDLVPQYNNPRHNHVEIRDKHKSKHVFKNFKKEDVQETFDLADNDLKYVNFDDMMCSDKEQLKKVKDMIKENMELIKEIHIHLQSMSAKSYPFISYQSFREYFLDRTRMPNTAFDKASYNALFGKIDFHTRQMERSPPRVFCRATIIETLLRLAKHRYCDIVTEQQIRGVEAQGKTKVRTDMLQGFSSFVKNTLKPYFLQEELTRIEFREDQLHNKHIDLIYSMNEQGIKAVHLKYAQSSESYRPPGCIDFLTNKDCVKLVKNDMKIDISGKIIKKVYCLSKQLVHDEQDERQLANYFRMTFLEFLEFIGRISDIWFENTEYEELPLHRKIEYFLERMLKLVGKRLVYQEKIIEEFSDSDPEY